MEPTSPPGWATLPPHWDRSSQAGGRGLAHGQKSLLALATAVAGAASSDHQIPAGSPQKHTEPVLGGGGSSALAMRLHQLMEQTHRAHGER